MELDKLILYLCIALHQARNKYNDLFLDILTAYTAISGQCDQSGKQQSDHHENHIDEYRDGKKSTQIIVEPKSQPQRPEKYDDRSNLIAKNKPT